MKIQRPSLGTPETSPAEDVPVIKKRPPKLTVELSDEESEALRLYLAEHRVSQRELIRWLLSLLPTLPGGPPLRCTSRPPREPRSDRKG